MRLQEIYCLVSDAIHCLTLIDTASKSTFDRHYDKALIKEYMAIINRLGPLSFCP